MHFLEMAIDRLEDVAAGSSLVGMRCNEFFRDVLNVRLWRKQRRLNDTIDASFRRLRDDEAESRDRRIFVRTGHGIGKTFDFAGVVCWAMACWDPPPVVITSAPTFRQVKDQLWREVRLMWNGTSKLRALGEALTTTINIAEKHYAFGFSTNKPARFQGIHAEFLLFVIDEANGFPETVWEAIDSCVTGGRSMIVAIGNPVVPYGRFYRGFAQPTVQTMKISARTHPNVRSGKELIAGAVTRQWVEELESDYSHRPDVVASRIDAEWPPASEFTLVSRELFRAALEVEAATTWPCVLAVDVARYGSNLTSVALQRGQRLERFWEWGKRSTVETANKVHRIFQEVNAETIVVDDDGVGGGVTDQLIALSLPVIPFHNGGRASDPERWVNAASEAYDHVKTGLERGLLSLSEDEVLEMQITTRDYQIVPGSKMARMKLEPKGDYVRRTGLSSPDRADAWAMSVWGVMNAWLSGRAA